MYSMSQQQKTICFQREHNFRLRYECGIVKDVKGQVRWPEDLILCGKFWRIRVVYHWGFLPPWTRQADRTSSKLGFNTRQGAGEDVEHRKRKGLAAWIWMDMAWIALPKKMHKNLFPGRHRGYVSHILFTVFQFFFGVAISSAVLGRASMTRTLVADFTALVPRPRLTGWMVELFTIGNLSQSESWEFHTHPPSSYDLRFAICRRFAKNLWEFPVRASPQAMGTVKHRIVEYCGSTGPWCNKLPIPCNILRQDRLWGA